MKIVIEFADFIDEVDQVKAFCRREELSEIVIDMIKTNEMARHIVNYKGEILATIKIKEKGNKNKDEQSKRITN